MISDLTPLRACWLVLAGAGAVTALARGLPAPDLSAALAMIVLSVWSLVETMVRRDWWALLALPVMVLGIGCALPFYLFLRSRRIV
ncbi:MAG: DUF2834 domain-containing protein [Paracoccus sp. (in: a-proteobacteria)]|nr:DUF2834 domain-containing protein [Paracoccus sp. (in: a-proteobacteria)]